MPSVAHQAVVELLRDHPELVLRLLPDVAGFGLPSGVAAVGLGVFEHVDEGRPVPFEVARGFEVSAPTVQPPSCSMSFGQLGRRTTKNS